MDTTTIHWWNNRKELTNQYYHPTKLGLFMITFNGGVTNEAWYRKASRICAGIDAYAPFGEATSILFGSPCPETCVSHYRTRCNVYSRLTTIGYVVR